jgi:hypothetical protein
MKAIDIEVALFSYFKARQNIIVPNVSWGMGLNYESDMVVLRPSGYASEIEIKVSASDIKADKKKKNCHHGYSWVHCSGSLFRELWFAVPEKLKDHPDIPEHAGILVVSEYGWSPVYRASRKSTTTEYRKPKICQTAIKWTPEMRMKLLQLGVMRIGKLKSKIRRIENGLTKPRLNRSRKSIRLDLPVDNL